MFKSEIKKYCPLLLACPLDEVAPYCRGADCAWCVRADDPHGDQVTGVRYICALTAIAEQIIYPEESNT